MRDRMMTLSFIAFSFGLAFWQSPGWAAADTKIDLQVDPVRFLAQVASVWTPTTDLGDVHSSQYSGYLWPMGPFYAALHSVGIGAWVVQRLWLGLVLALAAWGMVRLLDALVGRPRGVVHLVGGAFYLLNPFVIVSTARTSLDLLGYAALPWLMLVTYHGIRATNGWRAWRGWWWAAAFALIFTSTGGGVNAGLIGWVLVGPLVLLLYEPTVGATRWRDSLSYLARVILLGVLASLWWIVPVLASVRYGVDFLKFTEQPSTIWATNSATESLRLMGFWNSYSGVGFGVLRPLFSDAGTLLFNPLVVGASLLLPAIAVAGFVRARRPSYAPLLLALVVVGVVMMTAGFPNGTPLRGAMVWIYEHIFVLRFMRTNYKVAPVVAVGVAGLLGLAVGQLLMQLRSSQNPRIRRAAPMLAVVPLLALIVLAGLPMLQGKAIDKQIEFKHVPAAWTEAGRDLDRTLRPNARALVLPGQIFAFYTWGGTGDAILPRLTDKPVAVRSEPPYSDPHAAELLNTVDDLVQQRRLVPGQLRPLLNLMGVGAVVTGSDDDISRSGAIDPAAAAGELNEQLGPTPSRSYGPVRTFAPAAGDLGAPMALPQVRRYNISGGRGIVHVDPPGPAMIVDGGAEGIADLAAFGGLPASSPIFYAADLSTSAVRAQAARGADVVISDSNRRAEYVPEYAQQNQGPFLSATEPLPAEAATLDPFPGRGTDAQTVSVLQGAKSLTAPTPARELGFPEHAPIAAFDGDLSTSWVADRFLPLSDAWIQIEFNKPRDVPYVDVYPLSDSYGTVKVVNVNGIRSAVGSGWTRIPVHLHRVTVMRIRIDRVVTPTHGPGSNGGFREIRIPGVRVRQLLRTPTIAGQALAGENLNHDALTFEFERTTGTDPFRRNTGLASSFLNSPSEAGDAEKYIARIVFSPAARLYTARAWIYPSVTAPDSALDRLAGVSGSVTFNSSSRYQDQPAYRASSAFDGRAGPGWIGVWAPQTAAAWISWRTARPLTLSRLVLRPPPLPVRIPTLVRLSWSGGDTPPLRVSAEGSVTLPAPVRARSFRLTVLQAQFAPGATLRQRQAQAVGIGTLVVPGLHVRPVPRTGRLRAGCGSVALDVAGRRVALQPVGTIQQLDAGMPLQARSCSPPVRMAVGTQEVSALPGTFSVDRLQLNSPAPSPPSTPAGGGQVVQAGTIGNSSVSGVRLALKGPSWIVLGEGFNRGWRATCNGHSLGAPQVIDVYANGWPAPSGCRRIAFSFAPQSSTQMSYVISALGCLALVVFVLLGATRVRARRISLQRAVARAWPEPVARALPLPLAVAVALALAVVVGLIFAERAGAVSFPLLVLIFWRGVGTRPLARVAVLLLAIAVPAAYLIASPPSYGGGFNFGYSTRLIWAHWIGVAAIVLLGLSTFKEISAARQWRSRAGPPSAGGGVKQPKQDPVSVEQEPVVRR